MISTCTEESTNPKSLLGRIPVEREMKMTDSVVRVILQDLPIDSGDQSGARRDLCSSGSEYQLSLSSSSPEHVWQEPLLPGSQRQRRSDSGLPTVIPVAAVHGLSSGRQTAVHRPHHLPAMPRPSIPPAATASPDLQAPGAAVAGEGGRSAEPRKSLFARKRWLSHDNCAAGSCVADKNDGSCLSRAEEVTPDQHFF